METGAGLLEDALVALEGAPPSAVEAEDDGDPWEGEKMANEINEEIHEYQLD